MCVCGCVHGQVWMCRWVSVNVYGCVDGGAWMCGDDCGSE